MNALKIMVLSSLLPSLLLSLPLSLPPSFVTYRLLLEQHLGLLPASKAHD